MAGQSFLGKMGIKQKIITLCFAISLLIVVSALFVAITNIKKSLLSSNEDKINQITEIRHLGITPVSTVTPLHQDKLVFCIVCEDGFGDVKILEIIDFVPRLPLESFSPKF